MAELKKDREIILEKTAREYFESAREELQKGRNNSAVVLFFKSLVALTDLCIYKKTGKTPSSHGDRFALAKDNFSDIYNLLDKDFPFYQDSYNVLMSKELAEVIKEDAEEVAQKIRIKL